MVMPRQHLMQLTRGAAPIIRAPEAYPVPDGNIQPGTLDFRLGPRVIQVGATFLPQRKMPMSQLAHRFKQFDFRLRPDKTMQLNRGEIYLVELLESFALPKLFRGKFSTKSTIGRTDTFVRTIVEGYSYYDRVHPGYNGQMWALIAPRTFNIGVRVGTPVVQGQIVTPATEQLTEMQLVRQHLEHGIVYDQDGNIVPADDLRIENDCMYFGIDLDRDVVGLRAKRNVSERLDLCAAPATYEPRDYWEPIYRPKNGAITIDPVDFYLFATDRRIKIPDGCCAEMIAVDTTTGEHRSHYAGFFDPGFGRSTNGTIGVLEVRGRDLPALFFHEQIICGMAFYSMDAIPDVLYGADNKNSYTSHKPSLAKIFAHRYEAWEKEYWRF